VNENGDPDMRRGRRERITSGEFTQSSTILVAAIVNRSWATLKYGKHEL